MAVQSPAGVGAPLTRFVRPVILLSVPAETFDRPGPASGPALGELVALFRRQSSLTRGEVIALTGLSRSTVNQRMEALTAANLLTPVGAARSTGGRRPSRFAFNAGGWRLLVAHIGASGLRAALCDLAGTIAAERSAAINVAAGPGPVLGQVESFFDEFLADTPATATPVAGIGISVPGPVEFASGRVISPPIMPGWDGYDIPGHFARFAAPVLVDNDVNAMALGEQRVHYPHARDLLMIKVSTGVGAGLIHGGQVIRGAQGCAGDIGHITVTPAGADGPACRCGRTGCAEAYAGGWALLRDMHAQHRQVENLAAFVDLVRGGDPLATSLARRASGILGDLIASAVNLLNPSYVIIGGVLSRAEEIMLAGIRQAIYNHCTPLATKSIQINPGRLEPHAGITGVALMCADYALAAAGFPAPSSALPVDQQRTNQAINNA